MSATDFDGRFRFDEIGAGAYCVRVATDGFAPVARDVTSDRIGITLAAADIVESCEDFG